MQELEIGPRPQNSKEERRAEIGGAAEMNGAPIQEVLGRTAINGTGEGDLLHGVSRDCVSLMPTS